MIKLCWNHLGSAGQLRWQQLVTLSGHWSSRMRANGRCG